MAAVADVFNLPLSVGAIEDILHTVATAVVACRLDSVTPPLSGLRWTDESPPNQDRQFRLGNSPNKLRLIARQVCGRQNFLLVLHTNLRERRLLVLAVNGSTPKL